VTRPRRQREPEVRTFADLDDVPPGVALCQDDRCKKFDGGLHEAHRVSARGRAARIEVCRNPNCLRNYQRGTLCKCQQPNQES
jgi:hypothetical protein